jgi:hypothetical protein
MFQKQTIDVVDAMRLEQFRKKREEWLSCLNGDDLHSIWKQQSSLLWDYALFQTVRELRKEALANSTTGIGFNEPVFRLFEAGFAVIQATGIRRLTEKQWKDKSGRVIPSKRVISLGALVDDIRENRELLTREVYLGCHELPFDPSPSKLRCFDRIAASGQKLYKGVDTKGPEAWRVSERAHELFDKLSEKTRASRSRNDPVSLKWFVLMATKIKSCEDVCVLTDKFIAHAADPVSRAGLKDEETTLSLSRLAECHQAMLRVAGFIGGQLLQDSMGASLPVSQFDQLENLDKAWVSATGLEKAREHWQRHADAIEKWAAASLM